MKDQVAHFMDGCGATEDTEEDPQLEFLTNFYFSTGNEIDSGSLHRLGWLADCGYCSWGNITCNNQGEITDIYIADVWPPLTGTLATEIGNLHKLESLVLHSNDFTGTIPSEVGELYSLTTLKLHYNSFEGEMPEEICDLGGVNGIDTFISADCAKPLREVECRYRTCCDACYSDTLRPNNLRPNKLEPGT